MHSSSSLGKVCQYFLISCGCLCVHSALLQSFPSPLPPSLFRFNSTSCTATCQRVHCPKYLPSDQKSCPNLYRADVWGLIGEPGQLGDRELGRPSEFLGCRKEDVICLYLNHTLRLTCTVFVSVKLSPHYCIFGAMLLEMSISVLSGLCERVFCY